MSATKDDPARGTAITHAALGRMTGRIDPNMGTWGYQHGALEILITHTDAMTAV